MDKEFVRMKGTACILAALAAVAFSGFALPHLAGESPTRPVVAESVAPAAVVNWSQNAPKHWRACLLQHR
jgi:hypothetical protein